MKYRHHLILLALSVIASSPAISAPAPFSDPSSAAALAPAAPHERLLYAGPVEDCRRRCAGDFAGCNTNHPDQTAQCKHDYSQCLAKCTSHNG